MKVPMDSVKTIVLIDESLRMHQIMFCKLPDEKARALVPNAAVELKCIWSAHQM